MFAVSGVSEADRESVRDYLMSVDTGLRRNLLAVGSEHVGEALNRSFLTMCNGLVPVRNRSSHGIGDDGMPWVVCMSYTPLAKLDKLRGVMFWDTSCPPGDFRDNGGNDIVFA